MSNFTTSTSTQSTQSIPTITPTTEESKLFNYLLSSLSHPSIPPSLTGLTLRVAGGWVRDKILNKQSHDIDIALDKCTGVQFAEWLLQYEVRGETEGEKRKRKKRNGADGGSGWWDRVEAATWFNSCAKK